MEDNKCIYCNIDTLEYHLYTCTECEKFWELTSEWIKNNLDRSFRLTICEIVFGIPIDQNQAIQAINFIILLGKWFINNSRTQNQQLTFKTFLRLLKKKIEEIILSKTINNVDPQLWEMDMVIAL